MNISALKHMYFYFSVLSKSRINMGIYLVISVVLGLLIPLANVFLPRMLVVGLMGESVLFGMLYSPMTQVLAIIAVFFVIVTFVQSLKVYIDLKIEWFVPYLQFKLREGVQISAMTMDFPKTEDKNTLNKIASAEGAIQRVDQLFRNICGVLSSCILLIVYSVMVIQLHSGLLFLLIINAGVGYVLVVKAKLYDASFRELRADAERKKNYLFQTMFDYSFGKETRLNSLNNLLSDKFKKQRNLKEAIHTKSENISFLMSSLNLLLNFIREAVVYALLIIFFINGMLAIEDFIMYIGLTASFSLIAKGMFDDASTLTETIVYLSDYQEVIELTDNDGCIELTDNDWGVPLETLKKYTLEFQNVSFTYPGSDLPVLHDINFTLENGKHTSLVGLNGAGKSSVVKLICRLYEPRSGEILLNGININTYKRKDYYRIIAPVFQDSSLYALSVKENITLQEDSDSNKMWSILETLKMSDKILTLYDSEDTQVLKMLYNEGVEFSGGEAQQLMIARAMYKDCGILLLDEPTSTLDALAEKNIYESFSRISKGRTTLFISHRLNSNRLCDNIIFLEDGKVKAQGTHDQLMEKCHVYRDLYNLQAQYYREINEKRA